MENMRVNHLPSLTWNALHMNDSRVDSAVTAGEAYIEKNLSMGLEEGIRGEELPCFEKIKTGMGPDMDALRKAGSIGAGAGNRPCRGERAGASPAHPEKTRGECFPASADRRRGRQ